ncbi:MAG: hypothetical protein FRX49_04952 [Trebouxia sp. A1-2]|nr:MAG: hypothetical protein FRX49_04952 [Trebouxia sp. A1-2]
MAESSSVVGRKSLLDVVQQQQSGEKVDSKRLMPVLHALHLAGGTAQLQDVKTASALNIGCVQTAKSLESLGQKQSSAEISSQQAALLSSWATPETILALTYTETVPTLQEYLHLFDGAISSTLDSERTWPPHAFSPSL